MQFAVAHVPASVHVAQAGQYASLAAREDDEHVRESQMRWRMGIENVVEDSS